ncbi:MAG: hypothetical protein DSY43_01235 [Gammaproteobacteria bacterium]|nr:MAG: hypothetical protein DSY43_01235 [Gammaproteobacteria bacterium]
MSNATKRSISACCGVQENLIEEVATAYRSVWKPKHQYNGLLYRTNEHIVAACFGEVFVALKDIFIVKVADQPKYYFSSELYKEVGFSDMGAKLVQKSNEMVIGPLSKISRKIMMANYEDVAGLPTFIVVDFMRRIFPIGVESVVVPYYPVANDMVLVMGNQPDSVWRAHVLSFNILRKVVTGHFFTELNDGLWVPEATRNQEIRFDSVIGVANGTWQRQYSVWLE